MRMVSQVILQLILLCAIVNGFAVQGSAGTPAPSHYSKSFIDNAPTSASEHNATSPNNVPGSQPPFALPPLTTTWVPPIIKGLVPSVSPTSPAILPPYNTAPPPLTVQVQVPSMQPSAPERRAPVNEPPPSVAPAPVETPSKDSPQNSPATYPEMPGSVPPSAHERITPEPDVYPALATPPSSDNRTRFQVPATSPSNEIPNTLPPMNHAPNKAPSTVNFMRHSHVHPPIASSPKYPHRIRYQSPASSPTTSSYKHNYTRNRTISPAPANSYPVSSHSPKQKGPVVSPALLPRRKRKHHAPPPSDLVSPSHYFPPPVNHVSPAPSPSHMFVPGRTKMPIHAPKVSPSGPSTKRPEKPLLPPLQALPLPPPPPNQDCLSTICTEPYTNTPPGSPCGCVRPMQVGLRLSVALYTFFPLVSELAEEIAAGIYVKQSQVRIIGASSATHQPEKTVVLIDLVPLGEKFDNTTAFFTYERFWHKQVIIKASHFGDYEVLYVQYPGLPPSPPSFTTSIDDGPYSGSNSNAGTIKPIGVDVRNRKHKDGLGGGTIAIIALSALVAMVLSIAAAWLLVSKQRARVCHPTPTSRVLLSSLIKPSGAAGSIMGSMHSSASLSFQSSIATYTGSAKTFSTRDIEKATNNLDPSRILGEGGFGLVYSGVLEDGTKVAVKVLKRDDHQGGREFYAEVEMLSRLHHRNLVKLIGICTAEHLRCLVYELIPNGSVESHLHGVDKEIAPLDWDSRMKIALGAARGLAYLHEDSSPRVIHRDFKSSNILLEHDFTPKVSDFGLARTAMDEGSRHISTRVMGTFGYVAPEYAMTGHLLVKSDVYSYGVVLLELLTGRKPVDMSQPPGQENLVAWARPLLASEEGLETLIDKSLGSNVHFDTVAKVAAIASMCVQPEVSQRPFMGEVVQALKLVCDEHDETKEVSSRNSSLDDLSSGSSRQLPDSFHSQYSLPNYENGLHSETRLSVSDFYGMMESGLLRRHSSSGPLRIGRSLQFWQKMRRSSGGSVSEHMLVPRLFPGSN